MAEYTYLARDAVTGATRGLLPFTSFSFDKRLNGSGQWTGTLPAYDATISGDNRGNLQPNDTIVSVLRDGVHIFSGYVINVGNDIPADNITVRGNDLLYIYKRRYLTSNYSYSDTDLFDIVEDVFDDAENTYNTNTILDYNGTSRNFSIDYSVADDQSILSIWESLVKISDSIEFRVLFGGSESAGLTHTIQFGYPQVGLTSTGIVFDEASDSSLIKSARDGGQYVNRIHATNVASENKRRITRSNAAHIGISYPLFESAESFADLYTDQQIRDRADEILERNQTFVPTAFEVQISNTNHDNVGVGKFEIGDLAEFRVSRGWEYFDGQCRIEKYKVSIDSDGADVLDVQLVAQQ